MRALQLTNTVSRAIASIAVALLITGIAAWAYADRRGTRSASGGGGFSFRLESDGRVLPTYHHRGRTYVEGRLGETYAIRVFNHFPERVEAVVTVDGRDAVSGRVGDYRTVRGYVIDPYGSVLIEGFRSSWSRVAAFRFTEVDDSYAARRGDASNVGVIGVAIFKEKRHRPRPIPRRSWDEDGATRSHLGTGYGARRAPGASAESTPAPRSEAEAADEAWGGHTKSRRARQGIGTRYGEDTYSPAHRTTFVRRQKDRPDAILAARYDDRQGLIARGVITPPPPRPIRRPRRGPDPFPASPEPEFAPPPPAYTWE